MKMCFLNKIFSVPEEPLDRAHLDKDHGEEDPFGIRESKIG